MTAMSVNYHMDGNDRLRTRESVAERYFLEVCPQDTGNIALTIFGDIEDFERMRDAIDAMLEEAKANAV
jgi:hypothetical protein